MCKHHAILYREPERLQILVSKGGPWKQFPGWQGTTGHCLSPIASSFLLVIYNGMSVFCYCCFLYSQDTAVTGFTVPVLNSW